MQRQDAPERDAEGPDEGVVTAGVVPVFADPSHRRRWFLRLSATIVAILSVIWVGGFGLSMYFVGKLPQTPVPSAAQERLFDDIGPLPAAPEAAQDTGICAGPPPSSTRPAAPVYAYVQAWPDNAVDKLADRCARLAGVLVEWYAYDIAARQLAPLVEDKSATARLRAVAGNTPMVPVVQLPMVAAEDGRAPLDDAGLRGRIAGDLADFVRAGGFAGLCINPAGLRPQDRAGLQRLMEALRTALAPGAATSCLVAAAEDDLWRDRGLTAAVDRVVLLAFRNRAGNGLPVPLAPQGWFHGLIADAVAEIGAGRLIVALGNHGQTSPGPGAEPVLLSYAETMHLVARHGGRVEFPASTLNTTVTFQDDAGRLQRIVLLDAVSLANQMSELAPYPVAGVALWSSGLEDPSAWEVLLAGGGVPIDRLRTVNLDDWIAFSGEGVFYRLDDPAVTGQRLLVTDPQSGLIVAQRYGVIPRPQGIERYGAPGPGEIVLTFDDGPDPRHTADLLDILKELEAPATFFTIGRNLMREPALVRRIVAEGHEIGSHSFLHPETDTITDTRLRLELNATQRLMVALIGRGTLLYRTPYGRSEGPLVVRELAALHVLEDAGYMAAGADIVPRDWEGLTADQIVSDVFAGLDGRAGKVIVLHDGGGDRRATVAAVAQMIPALRAEGYRIVPLASLVGLPREAVMPYEAGARIRFDTWSFAIVGALGGWIPVLFWVIIIAGTLRGVGVIAAALLSRPVVWAAAAEAAVPPVTVLIPAYNEAAVIADCVASVLGVDYPDLRVIVIDDGSTDATFDVVRSAFGADPRVRILREANHGKWAALNFAYGHVETDFVVAVDADTRLAPDAVRCLMRPFADSAVGAVAGMVRVGNRRGLLCRLQVLEYTTAQNIDRRAAELLNAMMVVPGAIGAWRVAAVRKAGLYSAATLTEDADLTVSVLRAGYRIVFAEDAQAVTEVPQTVRAFLAQRLRWTLGMMQTAWKHRGAATEGRAVGLVAIPDLIIFGVGLGLVAPLADLVFLAVLADMAVNLWLGQPATPGPVSAGILAGYLVLPFLDVLTVLLALRFDRRESLALVLLVPVQRLLARPLFVLTIWRAFLRAMSGTLAAWGQQVRKGLSPLPTAPDKH